MHDLSGSFAATNSSFVDYILSSAIKNRASDIHLEPDRDSFNIRLRIDGILYPVDHFPGFSKEEIVTRLKVLGQMDIAEHRFPQDGHFEYNFAGKMQNIRVSILPTIHGEAIVLRILNRGDIFIKLEEIGFDPSQLEIMLRLIENPSGMLLTTGPTGSGKTTLLYSIISRFNSPEKNIITLEDPIEIQMPGVRQTQINEGIGLTFAKTLRSVVRQDPDIIMLGEIRDTETAQMAIQAALTGIFVLSTYHTFDVPALVTRFQELGFSGSVIAQAVNGVVSTRLIRKICVECKMQYDPVEKEHKYLGEQTPAKLYRGKGCPTCQNKGYLGRTGLFEVVPFDEEMKVAITEKRSASGINELLKTKKIKKLKDAAMEKVIAGETSLEEMIRVVGTLE